MLVLALSGCGSVGTSPAESRKPVIDERSSAMRQPKTPFRTVVAGDTLYSIAWESGRDYRSLAAWNHISSPYTIKIGQQIRIMPPEEKNAEPENREKSFKHKNASASSDTREKVTGNPSQPKTANTKKTLKAGATVNKRNTADRLEIKKNKTTGNHGANKRNESSVRWSWPAEGTLLNHAGSGEPKGVDIAGNRGSVIRAAADGRVVYQGSGLRGYGQLIIIKHNDEFLSAYAHNDRIYVKEGNLVKRGEKIADMGNSGTDRTKLHFEIRRQGVPADPLVYLPKR